MRRKLVISLIVLTGWVGLALGSVSEEVLDEIADELQ